MISKPYISAIKPKRRVIRLTPMLKEELMAPNILPLKDLGAPINAKEDKKG